MLGTRGDVSPGFLRRNSAKSHVSSSSLTDHDGNGPPADARSGTTRARTHQCGVRDDVHPTDGQEGRGVGRYVDPVARVTVQYKDEPEQEAVLRNGFWFLSYDDNRFEPPAEAFEGDRSSPEGVERPAWPNREWLIEHGYQPDLIGVPLGFTFRGYDADGELVYDSSTDGPSVADCYADPTGTEFVGSWAGFDDPSECVRTHRWEPQD